MSDNPVPPNPPDPRQLLHDLRHNEDWKHKAVSAPGVDPALMLLRAWQSERLTGTYSDFLKDKRFRAACLFILSDIYAPHDFSQRDHDVERIHAVLSKVVPAQMLQLLTDVISLNTLTNELDRHLLRVLVDQLGVTDTITPQSYAEAYRICDNYSERLHQINLVAGMIPQVNGVAHLPFIGLALRLLYPPAHAAGWDDLYAFLQNGFHAFERMHDVRLFVSTVRHRETLILDQIFASAANPFVV